MNQETFYYWDGETLVLNVLGTPGAKQTKILKPRGSELKISVATAGEQGKATKAMMKFLAKSFGVALKDI